MLVPTFVLTPLTYLGGVFYSVGLLHGVWRKLTLMNPVFYIIEAFRYGLLETQHINPYIALTVIAACNVILWYTMRYLVYKGVGLRS